MSFKPMDCELATFRNWFTKNGGSAKSCASYESRLKTLSRVTGAETIAEAISDPKAAFSAMCVHTGNAYTRKSMVTGILKYLGTLEPTSPAILLTEWKRVHKELDSTARAAENARAPSMSTRTPFADIERMYATMAAGKPHATEASSLRYILLSVIVHLPPKRLDYGNMWVYPPDWIGEPEDDGNYVALNMGTWCFQKYKTAKVYGRIEEALPERLARDIAESVEEHPRERLFVKSSNGRPMNPDEFGKFVKATFVKLFGRPTGMSDIRHAYISERLDIHNMSPAVLNDIARRMMHSADEQRKYVAICMT